MMWELLSHLSDFVLIVHMEILDLIAPEGQSTGTDVQHYVWSQTCQHHRFILLGGRQLHPQNVQLSRQCRWACRADDGRTAELLRSVLIAENMWARCDPSEAGQLSPTLWEITQEGVIAHGHAFVKDSKQSFREKNYKANHDLQRLTIKFKYLFLYCFIYKMYFVTPGPMVYFNHNQTLF